MRIKGLDFLRGIAVLGVLCRHSHMKNVIVNAGGYGVDLFFVLSGFLVAGLLFNEYKKTGMARTGRFLIRRGFKIYPAFYFYLSVSILTDLFFLKNNISTSTVLSEVFFVQNYFTYFRIHTWSLAVEEHFYLILSVLIFLTIKFNRMENQKAVILFLVGMISLITLFRLVHCINGLGKPFEAFFGTHLRADGLFVGALLSFIRHFNYHIIEKAYKNRTLLYAIGAIMVLPAFLFEPGSFFMMTFGFNFLHIGFAVFILLLADENYQSFIFRTKYLKLFSFVLCFIGINSYSIYLWHLLVDDILDKFIYDVPLHTIVSFAGAITIGALSTYFIEKKFLGIRDKYFPGIA